MNADSRTKNNPDSSLRDHFLLAMPSLTDAIFAHSITYLCEHNEQGAMGIVINHPLDLCVEEVLQHLDLSASGRFSEVPVMAGGPVHMDHGFVLHRHAEQEWETTLRVTDEISLTTSRDVLAESGVNSVDDVRHLGRSVIQFSPSLWADLQVIRKFLFTQMYRAPSVMEKRAEVTLVIHDLFPLFLNEPAQLPGEWQAELAGADKTAIARRVSDYISGMTDRFALQEHLRIFASD